MGLTFASERAQNFSLAKNRAKAATRQRRRPENCCICIERIRNSMNNISFASWPFGALVAGSLCLSVLHGISQVWWMALRYKTFGPRSVTVQTFIALELLLQMLIFGIAMINVCGESRSMNWSKYVIGAVVALGAWITTSFVL
jgi:hypothetical protein